MNKIARVLFRYFAKGLLVVMPVGVAIFLIWWGVSTIDKALNLSDILIINPKTGKPVYIPGLGILSVVILVLLMGVLVTNVITDPIKKWFSRWFRRLPVFKFLYSSIKDLTEAFVGDEKKFSEPVLVEIGDTKRIGFLTQKDMAAIGLPDDVAIYFPWSYSFAGQVVIVPASKVKPIDKSAAQMMKFVISGGVTHLD